MLVSLLVGFPLGLNLGILVGNIFCKNVYKRVPKAFLALCDESADSNTEIEFPPGESNVSFFKQRLLKDTSPALSEPDYERIRFMNTLLRQLWPHLSPALHKEIIVQSKAPVQEMVRKLPLLTNVRVDTMDLGTRPFRIDSVKSYSVGENVIMLEAPLFWGGDIMVRVVFEADVAGKTVDIPIQVSRVQFKALARITLYPLVEKLPCVGGVTMSLLEQPTVDMDFRVLDSPDLLSIPPMAIMRKIVLSLLAGKYLIYPNEISVPIMPNFGFPEPPKGILRIHIAYARDLKSSWLDEVDPFVEIEVRKGRNMRTKVVENARNPEWNETKEVVVDDFESQKLKVTVHDDDLITSSLVGGVQLELSSAPFIQNPNEMYRMLLPVYVPKEKGVYQTIKGSDMRSAHDAAYVEDKVKEEVAKKPQAKLLIPMLMRKRAAKKARKEALSALTDANPELDPNDSGSFASLAQGNAPESMPKDDKKTVGGQVCLDVTFIPFANNSHEEKSEKDLRPDSILKRTITFSKSPRCKGVLSVHVSKAMYLGDSKTTYVELVVTDPLRQPNPDISIMSPKEVNEQNPKYNYKADFVNISTQSTLTLTIYEVAGMENMLSAGLGLLRKREPRIVGFVIIPVGEVSEIGHQRGKYTLSGAQSGEVHLGLSWLELELDDI
ncbi:Synaptotagmin-3 [Picochlorum sp. SENEW3]|nr:Synaptotagmin-3 [Picochlorum sp. SENEW3]WPT15655.1 Synaptotagmin-3 [Picochlorum sp. SENEW3]